MKLSNDSSLSSLPLLTTFLKSYSRPFLGLNPPTSNKQQVQDGTGAESVPETKGVAEITTEADELVEKDIRARFKRMCEGYYESVTKKLVKEHKVCNVLSVASSTRHIHPSPSVCGACDVVVVVIPSVYS